MTTTSVGHSSLPVAIATPSSAAPVPSSSSSSYRNIAAITTAIAGIAIGVYIAVRANPKSKKHSTNSMGGCQTSPSAASPAVPSSSLPYAVPPSNRTTAAVASPAVASSAAVASSPITIDDSSSAAAAALASSPPSIERDHSLMPKLAAARINPDANHPLILIVCGPSGVGKGTLLQMLQRVFPHSFAKSVSHTTRAPRNGEEDGKHYFFAKKDAMEAAIAANEFLEHAKVHDNYYGTSLKTVNKVQESKKVPILEVDIQGAHTIHHHPEFKDASKKPLVLFILPPRFDSLHSRLSGRGSETPSSLNTRLQTAKVELKRLADCDFCDIAIMNDNLDTAFIELLTSLVRVYPHLLPLLPSAQYEASLLYRDGIDRVINRDHIRAGEWLQRAADNGHTAAIATLTAAKSATTVAAPAPVVAPSSL